MAPDYNDGRWHGWNGGGCPVHPSTIVEVALIDGMPTNDPARCWYWDAKYTRVVAFRVLQEHREPRELWHVLDENGEVADTFTDRTKARDRANECSLYRLVHYREVMEGEAQ